MDANEAKQTEAALAALELKVVERLRKAEDTLQDRVRTVELKLQTLQQIAAAIAAVAVIFGLTGAWGAWALNNAKTKLDETVQEVTDLSKDVQNMVPVAQRQIESLQSAGTEQLKQFREEAKREADAASGPLQSEISTVKMELDGTGKRVTDLSGEIQKMVPIAQQQITDLQNAGAVQLKQFRDEAKREADEASGSLQSKISTVETTLQRQIESQQKAGSDQLKQFGEEAKRQADAVSADLRTEFLKGLQTRALQIVGASGQPLVSLSAGPAGGQVEIFGRNSSERIAGERIAFIGATDDGNSVLQLFDKSGRQLLRGGGGTLDFFNSDNTNKIASFGVSNNGGGGFWLRDKQGRSALQGQASDKGGNLFSFNPENAKLITNIGVSTDGDGGFWLSDRLGHEGLKGITSGNGGTLVSYNSGSGKLNSIIGASANGGGNFWLLDKLGNIALNGQASDRGGNLLFYNPVSAKVITNIGASADGDGGFWLSNKSGQELLKGIASDKGSGYLSYDKSGNWVQH